MFFLERSAAAETMDFPFAYKILWFTSAVFVIFPRFNAGLLSDYKICGDSECASLMSRVQAIRDHRGKDCRFLSFRRGDTIFVYHKLTGKREDLWAGTIDRQFGYFLKDAVKEEQVFATSEKVVETQKSDFICMDDNGYPIDSSHLDNSDEDGDDDPKIQNQEPETIQTTKPPEDITVESPSASIDSPPESPQQLDGTPTEEEESKHSGDTSASTREEIHGTPAAPSKQGGSTSSSWLGSSVTGWLGLGKEEQPGILAEEQKKNEKEETKEGASLTASVTGWLGFGGEGKHEDSITIKEEGKETAASITSTMTGWLGFGGDKNTDSAIKEQQEGQKIDQESEPKETFRSRRMSLDLEGSQLKEEKEMGTLDWLGNGLSSTLGLGVTNQESQQIIEEKEKPASSSWLDIGVGDIWGFGKHESEKEYKPISKDMAKDSPSEKTTASENAEISQPQPLQEEEKQTEPDIQRLEGEVGDDTITSSSSKTSNKSDVKEESEEDDRFSQSETDTAAFAPEQDFNKTMDVSDGSVGNNLPVDATASGDPKDMSPQTTSDENYQALGGAISMIDGEGSAEVEGGGHQIQQTTGSEGENNNREPGEEQIKTASDSDRDVLIQSDTNLGSDLYTEVGNEGQQESGTAGHLEQEAAKITDQVENIEESTVVSLETDANHDNREDERSKTERHRDPSPEEERKEKNQSPLSLATANEENGPSSTEYDSVTAHNLKPDNLDTVDMMDASETVRESHDAEIVHSQEAPPVKGISQDFESSHTTNTKTVSVHENASEDQTLTPGIIMHSEDHGSGSRENENVDAAKVKVKQDEEEVKQIEDVVGQHSVEEGLQREDEVDNEVYELQKKEKLEDVNKVKEEEKHDEMKEMKEEHKQNEIEELNEEEKQEQAVMRQGEKGEAEENKKQEEKEEENEGEGEELNEEDKQEQGVMRQGEKGEAEENKKQEEKEEENQGGEEVLAEVKEEEGKKKHEGLDEVKKEEKKEGALEEKLDKGVMAVEEEIGELREGKEEKEEKQEMTEELQMEEEKTEVEEKKQQEEVEVEKQENITTLTGEEKLDEMEEVNEEEKQKEMHNGEEQQVETPFLEKQEKDSHDIGKPDSESSEKTHDENAIPKEQQGEEQEVKRENVEECKEEKTEVDEVQQVTEAEGETTDKEEQNLTTSKEPSHPAPEMETVEVKNENLPELKPSSADDSMIQERKLNEQVLESGTLPSEDEERARHETSNISESDMGEKINNALNATSSEDIYSNMNISDHIGLKVEQTEAPLHTDRDQHVADGSSTSEGETAKTNKTDHLAENADLFDQDTISQRHEGPGLEESETRIKKISSDQAHSEAEAEIQEGTIPHASQDSVGSSVYSGDYNRGEVENKMDGAFGLFTNAFGFFSQTPDTKTKEATESPPGSDTSTTEISQPQAPHTSEPDTTTNTSQVPVQDVHQDSPVTTPPPPSSTLSPSAENPVQTKALSKLYKNLLVHVGVEELTYLVDLFGRNKLQFLDYILGSSETGSDDPDNDESILSDIERLLHHHRETVIAPNASLSQAPQEDKGKTKTLIALQKLEFILEKVRETFNTRKSDVNKANLQDTADASSTQIKDKEESRKPQDSSVAHHTDTRRDEWKAVERDSGQLAGVTEEERETEDWKRSQKETEAYPRVQQGSSQPEEGGMKQILDLAHQIAKESVTHAHEAKDLLIWITLQVVSALPDDLRPGPDLYGLPWEPVIISTLVGLVTMLLFTCRCYSSVKSRMYRSKERWMAEQVAQLLEEKCKVLDDLSKCQQEYDDLEESLRESGVLAQTQKTEQLEIKTKQVDHANRELERDIGQLKDQLEQQREHRQEQEKRIAGLEETIKTLEDETKDLQSQEEQAQTTLKVYNMNSDRLQKNVEMAGEESTLLQESNAQLRQQAEGWAERVSELEAEIRRCEDAYSGMQQDVANKDERIMSLTDHLLRMKAWDSDLENDESGEGEKKETTNGTAGKPESEREGKTDAQSHLQKVQKLIYAAKLNADLKSLDEDKDRVFAKLNDEVKAKEDLQESIRELENEKLSLQSDAEHYSDQVQRLQQKLQIMTEMYQENELKLHRLLTVEERERLQKEEKLNKADKNIALAIEEVNNYRQRAEEMEEELEKTKQSYQTQISAHEKKAHNNWLAARAAERELADIRRENALLRQKLTDTQFKLDAIDKDPYALDSLARPLPFRAERSPYGPSPLGRPASETRAFLSPPTLMDGPPARLSPRMSRGPVEPPAGQGELERSGGPHSDSGSISPTWERDRRGAPLGPPPGPLGPPGSIRPPGYIFSEPGGPMYRRPPPGAIGILPPPGSLPPGPLPPHPRGFSAAAPPGPLHPTDIVDSPYRENNTASAEQQIREPGPGDRRTPPEADLRMGGPFPPGPPMDGPFPRRSPYGPPPPDFYLPRGPGAPPMRPMWTPPSGMMFPPRFPPSGPQLPNAPHPHYAPPMRPVAPDGLQSPSMGPSPPQQSLTSQPPPSSQSPEEHTTSPEDAI